MKKTYRKFLIEIFTVSTPQFPWEKAAEFATSVTWD